MDNTNGLMIRDNKYLPLELLTKIFYHVDNEILLKCHLVCKLWRATIQEFVWREKAKLQLGQFPHNKNIPWQAFYLICKKKPFKRNLLKNHSGEMNNGENWIIFGGESSLKVENPPVDVPELPSVPIFDGIHSCFTPSIFCLKKYQIVDLIAEGFDPYILDNYQPPIMIDEWYCCRFGLYVTYTCLVELLVNCLENNKNSTFAKISKLSDSFEFNDKIIEEKWNQWLHVSHVFENYGCGLRSIVFGHTMILNQKFSEYQQYDIAHSVSAGKMAGACVRLQIPSTWESKLELHDLF